MESTVLIISRIRLYGHAGRMEAARNRRQQEFSWQYHAKMSRRWQDRRREFNIKLDFREMKLEITGSRRGPVGLCDPTSSPITTRINNGSQYGIVPILNYECLPL
jgi:hypothetical protein